MYQCLLKESIPFIVFQSMLYNEEESKYCQVHKFQESSAQALYANQIMRYQITWVCCVWEAYYDSMGNVDIDHTLDTLKVNVIP